MKRYPTVMISERSPLHLQQAVAAAPPELDIVALRQPTWQELLPHLGSAVFLISERIGVVDAATMAAAPNLKFILRLGALPYGIDLAAARSAGIIVATWPVRGTVMVAEHVVLQMLALAKRLLETNGLAMAGGDWGEPQRTDENTFAYNWTGRHGLDGLWQKTVGVLGFGEIGAELAFRLHGWGCVLLYNRRHRLSAGLESELGIVYAERANLLQESDFLVNLLPYAPATDHSLGATEFALMKPGAFVVSCGSGSVIDEAALAAALDSGHLAGAALDTYEWEPLREDEPLRQLALRKPQCNILLTPHTAASAPPTGTIPPRGEEFTPIIRYLRGEPVPYRVV